MRTMGVVICIVVGNENPEPRVIMYDDYQKCKRYVSDIVIPGYSDGVIYNTKNCVRLPSKYGDRFRVDVYYRDRWETREYTVHVI